MQICIYLKKKILTKYDEGTKTFKLHIKGKNFHIIDT